MTRPAEFSRKVKRAIIERANGKCELCQAVLKPGSGDVDHILPIALGGENKPANGRLICKPCHAAKTASDVRQVRKADRQRDKSNGAIRAKGSIRSAPFPAVEKVKPHGKAMPARRSLYQEKV